MTQIDRRRFLLTTAGAALATAAPAFAQGGAEDAKLRAQLDRMFEQTVDDAPRFAPSLGRDRGAGAALKSQLDDNSAAGKQKRLERARRWVGELKAIDREKLSAGSKVDLDVVLYANEQAVRNGDKYRFGDVGGNFSPYVISQRGGAYANVPDFLDSQHRIANAEDAQAYLSRLSAFAKAMDNDVARQATDVAAGVVPPDFVCDLSLGQMRALRGQPPPPPPPAGRRRRRSWTATGRPVRRRLSRPRSIRLSTARSRPWRRCGPRPSPTPAWGRCRAGVPTTPTRGRARAP